MSKNIVPENNGWFLEETKKINTGNCTVFYSAPHGTWNEWGRIFPRPAIRKQRES